MWGRCLQRPRGQRGAGASGWQGAPGPQTVGSRGGTRLCARGGHGGTFLDELAPALGPVGELLRVRLLDLGALLHAVHQVVTQAVAVIYALHRPLVVPHLAAKGRARLPRAPRLPPTPSRPGRRVLQGAPAASISLPVPAPTTSPARRQGPEGSPPLSFLGPQRPASYPTVYTLPHPT